MLGCNVCGLVYLLDFWILDKIWFRVFWCLLVGDLVGGLLHLSALLLWLVWLILFSSIFVGCFDWCVYLDIVSVLFVAFLFSLRFAFTIGFCCFVCWLLLTFGVVGVTCALVVR